MEKIKYFTMKNGKVMMGFIFLMIVHLYFCQMPIVLANENLLDIKNGGINISVDGDYTIKGRSTTQVIIVKEGVTANINLENIDIDLGNTDSCAFQLEESAKVTLNFSGINRITSGNNQAGIEVSSQADLIIGEESTGQLIVQGGVGSAGIGGKRDKECGNITICGGIIQATGGSSGAGIGGGYSGSVGNITITGGKVTATGGAGAAGIGNGNSATNSGYFSTGDNGNAYISATAISDRDDTTLWSGVIFMGEEGKVYKDQTIEKIKYEIPAGDKLTVPPDTVLTVEEGAELINYGTINNEGMIKNKGIIRNTIEGNQIEFKDQKNQTMYKIIYPKTIESQNIIIPNPYYSFGMRSAWMLDGIEYGKSQNVELQKAVQNKFNNNESSVLVARYTAQSGNEKTLTVIDGSGQETTSTHSFGESVVVRAQPKLNDEIFSNWVSNGRIVSYNPTYGFYISEDQTMIATYSTNEVKASGTTHIESVSSDVETHTISFTSMSSVPIGSKILEAGVIIGRGAELSLDKVDGVESKNLGGSTTAYNFRFIANKLNVNEGEEWYGRAYLKYKDSEGKEHLVYGDEVRSGKLNSGNKTFTGSAPTIEGTTYMLAAQENILGNNSLSFTSMSSVPNGWEILGAGIIITCDPTIGKNEELFRSTNPSFNKDSKTSRIFIGNTKSLNYQFTLNKLNVMKGDTWYARAYLKYKDQNGNEMEAYGDIIEKTLGGNE